MPANGSIVDTPTIVNHGSPAQRFDIVILAEGFQQRHLKLFDAKAKLLADRLLAMPPFDGVAHLINVHTVRTISTDAGVSGFPGPSVQKKTFYNFTGGFFVPGLASSPPSFMGTRRPEVILDAAGRIAPVETLELFIVLVNVKARTASAFPDQQLAVTGLHSSTADLVNLTAHECGHAIARTAEEYIDCDGPTPGRTYRNQVTEDQRLAGDVWWKSLAKPSELDAAGNFRAVHRYGDAGVHFTATLQTPVFDAKPSLNGKLGLYWGCQDIDTNAPAPPMCDQYLEARGRGYYRSMAACKMRQPKSPFCRVCSALIVERIEAAAL